MSTISTNSRQTPRLQNTSKPSIGSGSTWGFGLPGTTTSNAGNGFNNGGLGSGIGSSPGFGLGSNRPAQLSGFAQIMGGGGSGNNSIDMSDFPSLSGGPQPSTNTTQTSWNSGNIFRAQQQQQRIGQPSQPSIPQQTPQRWSPAGKTPSQDTQSQDQQPDQGSNTGNDFPPLSGQTSSNGGIHRTQTSSRSPDPPQLSSNGLPSTRTTTLPFRDTQTQSVPSSQAPIGRPQVNNVPPVPNTQPLSSSISTVKRYADMSEKEKYGLEGLAAAYEARKALESGQPVDQTLPPIMRSGLFFGQDLNSLGIDLDNPEPIWPTFTAFPASTSQAQGASSGNGGFDFHDRAIVPEFVLPPAYTVNNVLPLATRLGSLSDETLFCIFYQNPRDLLQEQAAQELTARDWRWHKVLRQWLQKDTQHSASSNNSAGGSGNSSLPILDLTSGAPVGVQAQPVSAGVERGVYVFFDVMNWRRERREFVLAYDELDQRFTPNVGMVGTGQAGLTGSGVGMGGPVLIPGREGSTMNIA